MILLASQSAARRELLQTAQWPFAVVRSTCDEEQITHSDPAQLALLRAQGKARAAVVDSWPEKSLVLGVDTVTALGDSVLGKPADIAECAAFLRRMSGTRHAVITAHVARSADGREAQVISTTWVHMRELSAQEIETYAHSGDGLGKAGGYGIQSGADSFVSQLEGAHDTVVGMHLQAVAHLYRELLGLPIPLVL